MQINKNFFNLQQSIAIPLQIYKRDANCSDDLSLKDVFNRQARAVPTARLSDTETLSFLSSGHEAEVTVIPMYNVESYKIFNKFQTAPSSVKLGKAKHTYTSKYILNIDKLQWKTVQMMLLTNGPVKVITTMMICALGCMVLINKIYLLLTLISRNSSVLSGDQNNNTSLTLKSRNYIVQRGDGTRRPL